MSDDPTSDGMPPAGDPPSEESSLQVGDLLNIWLKVVGWGVTLLGFVVIYRGLSESTEPGSSAGLYITVILIGASIALAGRGVSDGSLWAFPLAAFVIAVRYSLPAAGLALGVPLVPSVLSRYFPNLVNMGPRLSSNCDDSTRASWVLWGLAWMVYLMTLKGLR